MRAAKKNKQNKNIAVIFFIFRNKLVFSNCFFYLPTLTVFAEIGNNLMRALGRKKRVFFSGNARPKSNAPLIYNREIKYSGLYML